MNPQDRYDSLFQFYADKYHIEWRMQKAQAMAESALNPDAISRVGAKGIAQFMDKTWKEWGDGTPGIQVNAATLNPFDPEDCINAQAAYMQWLFGRISKKTLEFREAWTLAAYNWGIGNVENQLAMMALGGGRYVPLETKQYVNRINGYMKLTGSPFIVPKELEL